MADTRRNGAVTTTGAPAERIRVVRDVPEDPRRDYVLYWMTASRRLEENFSGRFRALAGRARGVAGGDSGGTCVAHHRP